jgi:hypothetical protein
MLAAGASVTETERTEKSNFLCQGRTAVITVVPFNVFISVVCDDGAEGEKEKRRDILPHEQ